jgi:hypothetical protein
MAWKAYYRLESWLRSVDNLCLIYLLWQKKDWYRQDSKWYIFYIRIELILWWWFDEAGAQIYRIQICEWQVKNQLFFPCVRYVTYNIELILLSLGSSNNLHLVQRVSLYESRDNRLLHNQKIKILRRSRLLYASVFLLNYYCLVFAMLPLAVLYLG